ncbi:MAG: hypothetical protein ABL921_01845 [Pirellula sp.]
MNTSDLQPEDEQLTAYLDGELSAEAASTLENRLVEEEELRLRLAELRRTYELLDELPETPHNQRFTKSTLELVVRELTSENTQATVAIPAMPKSGEPASWWAWPRLGYLMGMLLATGICIGLGTRSAIFNREIRELGLAASMPGLSDVNELSIAESLLKEKTAIEVLRTHYSDDLVPPIPVSYVQRRTWIEGMTPDQIDQVNRGRQMLRKFPLDRYKRFAAIESQIEARPDSQEIQEVIRLVGIVLDAELSYKREDLDGSREKRAQFLREQIRYSAALAYSHHMPDSDQKAVEAWYEKELLPSIPELSAFRILRAYKYENFVLENHSELIELLVPTLSETARQLLEPLGKSDQMGILLLHWRNPDREVPFLERYQRFTREEREGMDLKDPERINRRRTRR